MQEENDKKYSQAHYLTLEDSEELLGDSIIKITDIHGVINSQKENIALLPGISTAVISLSAQFALIVSSLNGIREAASIHADASKSMAETFKRSEERQERLENTALSIAQGKDAVPTDVYRSSIATVVKWVAISTTLPIFVICGCATFYVLYLTKTDIKASLDRVEVTQKVGRDKADERDQKIDKILDSTEKK